MLLADDDVFTPVCFLSDKNTMLAGVLDYVAAGFVGIVTRAKEPLSIMNRVNQNGKRARADGEVESAAIIRPTSSCR